MEKYIPICKDCPDVMIQKDIQGPEFEKPVGCKRLNLKQWLRGYRPDAPGEAPYQHDCRRLTK
jgi:hypothetical protein